MILQILIFVNSADKDTTKFAYMQEKAVKDVFFLVWREVRGERAENFHYKNYNLL